MKRFINIKLAEFLLKGDGLDSIEVQNMDYVLEFDEFVRSIKQNMDTKFSMFLGAGASVESGVPSAGECIWEWKRDIFISKNPVLAETHNNIKSEQVKRSIQNWLDNQGIYPQLNSEEEYSKYIEAAYKIVDDRRKYFQHLIEGKCPSLGYHIIALLAENEIVKSVWTTNFDGLMLKTAHSYGLVPIEVTLESQDRIFRNDTDKELLCIALHGDYKYGPLKNTETELDNQSEVLVRALTHEIEKRNFIVLGYSGRDNSVMDALERAYMEKGAGRIYWCGYGRDIPPKVQRFLEKINQSGRNAFYVPTDGFDKTMLNIAHMFFENEDLQRRIEEIKKTLGVGVECETTAFQPFADDINKCMDTNLFPIKFPNQCYQFKIIYKDGEKPWDYCRNLQQYNIIAVPHNDMVYAWGNINSIRSMCSGQLEGKIESAPILKDVFLNNKTFREMLLRALVTIIGKYSGCEYNKIKIWRKSEKFSQMVDGKKIVAYRGIQFSLFSDGKYNYLAFIPAYFYENKKDVSKEEHLEFSKKFIENICQRQANKNYYEYLEKWRKIIFRENTTICAMYPFDSDSGFEFKIVNKSMLVGMHSKYNANLPDATSEKRIQICARDLLDAELKFYNPRYGTMQKDFHPMRGLVNNMPYDYEMNNKVYAPTIKLGIICPASGQVKFESFLAGLHKPHTTRYNTDYVINYPGFHNVFGVGLDIPARSEWLALDDMELKEHDIYKAAIAFGKQINKRIEELGRNSHLDVIMIYIPKEYDILTSYEDEVIRFDLHDYVKAFAVQKHISTQFIREKTLDSELDCQIAWAISLAIYVKAGRTPWVLSNLRTDTAFAGIGYSVNHFNNGEQTLIGCSHIYASDGQGLRYKLSKIKDVTFDAQKNPYLSENEAYQLGLNIKELFFSSFSSLPKRVVIHKRTPFKEEEIAGLTKCLGSAGIKDIDLIEITYDENFKCFEYNKYLQADLFPVKRGCCFAINDNTAYLFTHGIAPSVISNRRYFQGGTNVPAPLKIVKHYGNGDLAQIASEILGLSKMNWNSFGLYSKLPCTIQSSNAIAKVGWLLPQYEGMIYEYRNFM